MREVRQKMPSAHIAWAFRGEKDQNDAFKRGASKLQFPKSKHNTMKEGRPCSEAVDFFELKDGKASWDKAFFQKIADDNSSPVIAWGGNWVTFKDYPHFQISKPTLSKGV